MMLSGKRVVIIGGSSGIGFATAKLATEQGAEVVIAARNPVRLDQARAQLGENVSAYALDIRDELQITALFAKLGEFDHLATPGCCTKGGPFLSTDIAQAQADFFSKFWGQYQAAKHGVPHLRQGGSIVLFSGIYSQRPPAGAASIAAINGGIESLGRALAVELSPLRVNVIAPGLVNTPAYASMPEEQREAMFTQTAESLPTQRLTEAKDVAQGVLYLMANPAVTGTTLFVDGGFTLR